MNTHLLTEIALDERIKTAAQGGLSNLLATGSLLGMDGDHIESLRSLPSSTATIEQVEALFADGAGLNPRKRTAQKVALKAAVRAICQTRARSGLNKNLHVLRRNGSLTVWQTDKIELAVRMAFLSVGEDSTPAADIARRVADQASSNGKQILGIEEVQDLVQEHIMRAGHFKVATHYILYRAARAEQRGPGPEAPAEQDSCVLVAEPDGTTTLWTGSDLTAAIAFASRGLDLPMSSLEIDQALRRSLPQQTNRGDLEKLLVMNARSLMELDPEFATFAGRILLCSIYREVLGWEVARDSVDDLDRLHKEAFFSYLQRGVEIGRIDKALLEFDTHRLSEAFCPSRDFAFDYLGLQTLYDRYLLIDKTLESPRRLETPQFFWMRVAMGLSLREISPRENFVRELFDLFTLRRYCPSTPTLFNSGTPHSQLSSCYLYKVDDSLESIMIRGVAENAMLSKWAGGLGGSWTAVRGTGAHIKGTNGESQGVIPFLKLHNDQLVAVNQGGKRRGSGCAYLETWHSDLPDFLELRRNVGDERRRTHDMNTANWIPDLFMKRMEARENWTLFRSSDTPDLHDLYGTAFEARYVAYEAAAARGEIFSRSVPAIDLWKEMLKMLFETGHPWITFKDPCNVRSPQDHAGVIHSSNLCTEITLNTSAEETAVCNLGSIVLDAHLLADGSIDHTMLRATVRAVVRGLDNVIDINFYPTEPAKRANQRHRPIGLGVMGLQNALSKRGTSFASDEALDFNDEFMEALAYYAYEASSDLAAERGAYSSFVGSKWERGILPHETIEMLEAERGLPIEVPRGGRLDWEPLRNKIRTQGMRNSNVLAIAPTATISNIMGTTPCIEPNYRNLYVKKNLGGDFIVINRQLVRDLKELGLWNKQMVDELKFHDGELSPIDSIPEPIKQRHLTAFSIDPHWIIDAAARRQKWIDQSQSLNLFLASADMKTLSHMYRRAWRTGLKTTYYLRCLAASKIDGPTDRKVALRGVVAGTATESACSLEARRNGEICEACQ